jgi:hypothetical protein
VEDRLAGLHEKYGSAITEEEDEEDTEDSEDSSEPESEGDESERENASESESESENADDMVAWVLARARRYPDVFNKPGRPCDISHDGQRLFPALVRRGDKGGAGLVRTILVEHNMPVPPGGRARPAAAGESEKRARVLN